MTAINRSGYFFWGSGFNFLLETSSTNPSASPLLSIFLHYRVKDERQENVQLPPSAVEHMQSLVERSEVGADSRVMDVGSGTGILLRFLKGAGVKQVGSSINGRRTSSRSNRCRER